MEAIAKHDFNATAEDELSFSKNQILKVLNTVDDPNWFRAEIEGKEGLIPGNYIELENPDWYYESITRAEAEKLLSDKQNGAFIVRRSESSPGDFSLSVKCPQDVYHFKVLRDEEGKYFLWVVKFNSLNKLVEYHRANSVSRSEDIKLRNLVSDEMIVQAIYDFVPTETEELELRKGDIITLTDQSNEHWWIGTVGSRKGWFPASYVAPYHV